jgi:hypothetical protein
MGFKILGQTLSKVFLSPDGHEPYLLGRMRIKE